MEFNMELDEHKKRVAMVLICGIVAMVLLWIGATAFVPKTVGVSFDKPRIMPGESATLSVEIRNTQAEDLANVITVITPESGLLTVGYNNTRTEQMLGAGAYRKLDFPVAVASTATPGSYKLTVTVSMGTKTETAVTYLEVGTA